ARKLESARVERLSYESLVADEKQLSHSGFGRLHVSRTEVRRYEPFQILLFRFGIERANVDACVFGLLRSTKIDKMASVGKERWLVMPESLGRRIVGGERGRGPAIRRNLHDAVTAARLSENDDSIPSPVAANHEAGSFAKRLRGAAGDIDCLKFSSSFK